MYIKVKRVIDFILALIGMPFLGIILLASAICIKLEDGGPVFYLADRTGRFGKPFKLYKLRSMKMNAPDLRLEDGSTYNSVDDPRVTKFGKFARKTSIDETPQLINILKGDMAIVGPRPLLVRYLPLYNEHQKHRHDVRPGFTGYAQVNGRNSISWEEKFDLDVYYTNHVSFLLDLKIIFKTVKVVVFREGISSETSVTMEEFRGTVNE